MAIGAPTVFAGKQTSSSSSTITTTTTAAIIAGNLAVVAFGSSTGVSSVSDGVNTYTKAYAPSFGSGDHCELWYCANCATVGSGATLTVHTSGSNASGVAFIAAQVSGVLSMSPFDSAVSNNRNDSSGGSIHPSITSGTPSQANEILFGVQAGGINSNSITLSDHAPFTLLGGQTNPMATGDNYNVFLSYDIISSAVATTWSPTYNSAPDWDNGILVGFKGAPPSASKGSYVTVIF